ncbi:MAG: cysteine hydrolase [Anaerolineae bacterium]|nr:cysteine hydrolase [Anaerolineae bacterium]
MKPALFVIDVQKAFYEIDDNVTQSLQAATWFINAAIALFREKALPIICVQHIDEEEGLVPGVEGFDVPDELDLLPTDVYIHKTKGNAFIGTPLIDTLHRLEVDTVILTGFCAEYCVLSTYRGAADLDFHPILLRGSLASGKAEHIRFVEDISSLITYGALRTLLP